jgi:hypothetical protein
MSGAFKGPRGGVVSPNSGYVSEFHGRRPSGEGPIRSDGAYNVVSIGCSLFSIWMALVQYNSTQYLCVSDQSVIREDDQSGAVAYSEVINLRKRTLLGL